MPSTLGSAGSAGRCSRCNNAYQRSRLRAEFFAAYGGACACCGETIPAFLTLDHLNNDGSAHRAQWGDQASYKLMRLLRQQGWPQDAPYGIACFNCNTGRHINGGICPHEGTRKDPTP